MNRGWLAVRRSVLDHIVDGRLKPSEYLALIQLMLLADSSTGGYTINAATLMHWCGYSFNLDTAQRALLGLHTKGYIWYRAKPGTKVPQPYWINKYVITTGPYRLRRTNFSQLLEKEVISQQDVWNAAEHITEGDAEHRAEHSAAHDADNNKKETYTNIEKNKTPVPRKESAPLCNSENDIRHDAEKRTKEEGVSAAQLASQSASQKASQTASLPESSGASHATPAGKFPGKADPPALHFGEDVPGYVFVVDGEAPGYWSEKTGLRVEFSEISAAAHVA